MTGTMLDIIRTRAGRIRADGVRLLGEFSGMRPLDDPHSPLIIMSAYGDHSWNALPPEAKQIQAQLLPLVDRFSELMRSLVQNLPSAAQGDTLCDLKAARDAIEQNGETWWKSRNEAVKGFSELIDQIVSRLEAYCGIQSDRVHAVADTNALLENPDIERWLFDGVTHFTVILSPSVLSELDQHKVNHRNEKVREKASTLIRKIKEYRRRGSLQDGVDIVKGRISLRSIAVEPNMSQSLSWFDASNTDDRFLATTLEVIRGDLSAATFIVTSDINMQNKAEMAGIPFREVPETDI